MILQTDPIPAATLEPRLLRVQEMIQTDPITIKTNIRLHRKKILIFIFPHLLVVKTSFHTIQIQYKKRFELINIKFYEKNRPRFTRELHILQYNLKPLFFWVTVNPRVRQTYCPI